MLDRALIPIVPYQLNPQTAQATAIHLPALCLHGSATYLPCSSWSLQVGVHTSAGTPSFPLSPTPNNSTHCRRLPSPPPSCLTPGTTSSVSVSVSVSVLFLSACTCLNGVHSFHTPGEKIPESQDLQTSLWLVPLTLTSQTKMLLARVMNQV